MVSSKPNTIVLKGSPIMKEGAATSALSPGHLLQFDGAVDKVKKNTHNNANCRRAVAVENLSIGGDIDTAYATGDTVLYASFSMGSEALLVLAAGEAAIVIGDRLTPTNIGTVKKAASTDYIAAYAMEAINNATGTTQVFIKVEIA